jgi:hypothetical protein
MCASDFLKIYATQKARQQTVHTVKILWKGYRRSVGGSYPITTPTGKNWNRVKLCFCSIRRWLLGRAKPIRYLYQSTLIIFKTSLLATSCYVDNVSLHEDLSTLPAGVH